MERVGWMPWCVKDDGMAEKSALGPWPKWIEMSKARLRKELRDGAVGFRFKIVPVYAKPPKSR